MSDAGSLGTVPAQPLLDDVCPQISTHIIFPDVDGEAVHDDGSDLLNVTQTGYQVKGSGPSILSLSLSLGSEFMIITACLFHQHVHHTILLV